MACLRPFHPYTRKQLLPSVYVLAPSHLKRLTLTSVVSLHRSLHSKTHLRESSLSSVACSSFAAYNNSLAFLSRQLTPSASLRSSRQLRHIWTGTPRTMPMQKSEYISEVWKDGIFNNKVVFCTGGNGSICSAQVRAMVYLGANACIVGRNVEKTDGMAKDIMTARKGSKVIGIGAIDVRSMESLQKAVDTCVKELGGIDFLIAGAAGNFLASISQLSPNAFKTVMDIDVLGTYNTIKAALPHVLASAKKHASDGKTPNPAGTGGRIIAISATLHYQGTPLQTHVTVAKAGVDALLVNTAIEFGPLGITANVISPGPIGGTEGMDRLSKPSKSGSKNPGRTIPSGRYGTVKEIADATIYLFSDTGNYVNGETIVVDGGAWHTAGSSSRSDFPYPDFLLSGKEVDGVGGMKKTSKL